LIFYYLNKIIQRRFERFLQAVKMSNRIALLEAQLAEARLAKELAEERAKSANQDKHSDDDDMQPRQSKRKPVAEIVSRTDKQEQPRADNHRHRRHTEDVEKPRQEKKASTKPKFEVKADKKIRQSAIIGYIHECKNEIDEIATSVSEKKEYIQTNTIDWIMKIMIFYLIRFASQQVEKNFIYLEGSAIVMRKTDGSNKPSAVFGEHMGVVATIDNYAIQSIIYMILAIVDVVSDFSGFDRAAEYHRAGTFPKKSLEQSAEDICKLIASCFLLEGLVIRDSVGYRTDTKNTIVIASAVHMKMLFKYSKTSAKKMRDVYTELTDNYEVDGEMLTSQLQDVASDDDAATVRRDKDTIIKERLVAKQNDVPKSMGAPLSKHHPRDAANDSSSKAYSELERLRKQLADMEQQQKRAERLALAASAPPVPLTNPSSSSSPQIGFEPSHSHVHSHAHSVPLDAMLNSMTGDNSKNADSKNDDSKKPIKRPANPRSSDNSDDDFDPSSPTQ
jgi:hypothetical protein